MTMHPSIDPTTRTVGKVTRRPSARPSTDAVTGAAPTTPRIPVFVIANDTVLQAGVATQVRAQLDLHVVDDVDTARVAVVVTDVIDDEAVRVIRGIQRNGVPRVLVVAAELGDCGVLDAVEAGASAFLRRADATPAALACAVRGVAHGDGTLPDDLLGRLLERVGHLQRHVLGPRGLTMTGFAEREIGVLRLLADGLDTQEIARVLCYSERTVKNVIHDITSRLGLRNRTHAVAYAMRSGVI